MLVAAVEKEAFVSMCRRQRGLTLVELMVTLAVAVILALGVIPSYRSMIHNNRVSAEVNEFAGFLSLARSEAMKRAATVTITGSATSSNEWGEGAVATADVDVDGDADVDADDVVARLPAFGHGLEFDSASGVTSMSFTSLGYLEPVPGGNFVLCKSGSDLTGRTVVINAVGHLEISTQTCSE